MRKLDKELEKQKQALNRLVSEGYHKQGLRTPPDPVMEQSRKVDALITAAEACEMKRKDKNR